MQTKNISTELINSHMSEDEKTIYLKNLMGSMAKNTITQYTSRLRTFTAWCTENSLSSLPATPFTIVRYIEHMKNLGRSVPTMRQALAAIAMQHKIAGVKNPCEDHTVSVAMKAAVREIGTAPHPKDAVTAPVLNTILDCITGNSLQDKRDRALIAMGFMGAFRRSELVELKRSDITTSHDRSGHKVLIITVRHSKTDQSGQGMTKCIFSSSPTVNAVKLVLGWIKSANITMDEPLFMPINRYGYIKRRKLSGEAVAAILQKRAKAADVDLDVAGHSLRRGFVTTAIENGCSERSIMHQTGHRSSVVLRRYYEYHDVTTDNAASDV